MLCPPFTASVAGEEGWYTLSGRDVLSKARLSPHVSSGTRKTQRCHQLHGGRGGLEAGLSGNEALGE